MEDLRITDLGIVGVLMFMIFQYIVKPMVSSLLERRRNGHQSSEEPLPEKPSVNITDELKSLDNKKVDRHYCSLKHNYLDDILQTISTGQGELKHGQALITETLSGINREVGEIKATMTTKK